MKVQIFVCSLAIIASSVVARDLNARSLQLIKDMEGWRACPYQDVVKKWTIGYGHLIVPGGGFNTKDCITPQRGEEVLKSDVKIATNCISQLVKVSLTDNEFGALSSWAYNVGCGNAKSSTLIRKLNEKKKNEVCNELKKWNKAGKKEVKGLTIRRNKECILFSS